MEEEAQDWKSATHWSAMEGPGASEHGGEGVVGEQQDLVVGRGREARVVENAADERLEREGRLERMR